MIHHHRQPERCTFYDNVIHESQQTLEDLQRTFGAELILLPVHLSTRIARPTTGQADQCERDRNGR